MIDVDGFLGTYEDGWGSSLPSTRSRCWCSVSCEKTEARLLEIRKMMKRFVRTS